MPHCREQPIGAGVRIGYLSRNFATLRKNRIAAAISSSGTGSWLLISWTESWGKKMPKPKLFHAVAALWVLLVASVGANAADMQVPMKAPPPVMPSAFSWTGFYIGGNLGGAWAHRNVTDSFFGFNFSNGNNNGVFIAGGQVGGNYQFGNFVVGVEGTFDWALNNNNTTVGIAVPALGGNVVQVTSNNTWITTLAARLGAAYDRVLFYGKGGGAWVGNNSFTVTNVTTAASITGSNSNSTSGWLVGVGLEWAFASNWTLKAEYDYIGLSGRTFTIPAGSPFLAGDTFTTGSNHIQMATVGINYRFGMFVPYVN
jgi:outer membrane immunogenic protein